MPTGLQTDSAGIEMRSFYDDFSRGVIDLGGESAHCAGKGYGAAVVSNDNIAWCECTLDVVESF